MTALRAAFLSQAQSCEALGSPFMARLMRLMADHWPGDTALAARVAAWPGRIDSAGDSLPLRIAGGLHALVLSGQDSALAAVYPPHQVDDDALIAAVLAALRRHDADLCAGLSRAPQTNEVGRSAVLIAAGNALAARFGLPLALSELGASAGLNLMFDRFALVTPGGTIGPADSPVRLAPDWRGDPPMAGALVVADRQGVDLNPADPRDPVDRLRLLSYLWPDQPARLTRAKAAMAMFDAQVARGDAVDWLAMRLAHPMPDRLHLIYSTVAWQYVPAAAQARGTRLIEAAGRGATDQAPLAWLTYEADSQSPGAGVTLRLWPGDLRIDLGRACFHGRWIDWKLPLQD
ncbi:DUF2332 domain-containing protein [Paracoccus sp. p4-l81]|uniref:DUF2332 domain-containing protein n=1 Tax=Paracoccus sp. p4-l81 TaxID=3342806 RepID=UPI0035BB981B